MKKEKKRGWQMAWAGAGLLAANCLMGYLLRSPEALGLEGVLYNAVLVIFCVVDVAAVYLLMRKFFRKKK